ncbi:MAG: PIN domain-containing protein [Methylacidiphilales bacterium]|nr:PIN domain-containing protein [Candidatus Methylacidiphilales bacterium]
MIHLDANFLIGVANRHLPVESAIVGWLQRGEGFAASAVAWAEFLNGPVEQRHIQQMSVMIQHRVISFGRSEAEKASRLFNQTGRRRGSQPDCFIAATAICSGAKLATQNHKHFALFVPFGLHLA